MLKKVRKEISLNFMSILPYMFDRYFMRTYGKECSVIKFVFYFNLKAEEKLVVGMCWISTFYC